MKKLRGSAIAVIVCVVAATILMIFANSIQRGYGTIEVTDGRIETEHGSLMYILYRPKAATPENKAPAVLLLHGYQNDHETCAAYAIELARRGAVVLCLDEYGHGASTVGLKERGYVNHVVKVNYGNDSVEDGTFKKIGGSIRYRLLMNFSNLSFFDEHYSTDSDGNVIKDSSAGGSIAYQFLSNLPYVDGTRMGVSGHSMGTWSSWTVAADYSNTPIEPKAIVLQCGELFRNSVYDNEKYHFNNVLLLQAKYDEFSYFRDYQKVVDDKLLASPLRMEFMGTEGPATWNTTVGNFEDGSARRMELLYTNHRLTTHNIQGLKTSLNWFENAIDLPNDIPSNNIVAKQKEYFVLAAMLLILAAIFPFISLLMEITIFKKVRKPLPPENTIMPPKARLKGILFTILLSGLSFPFMTQLGHALLPLPEGIFRMTVGNGFIGWYLLLIIVMIVTSVLSYRKAKKEGIVRETFEPVNFLLSLGLAFSAVLFVYVINWLYYLIFDLDLRFIWPFFRVFNGERALQFLVYIPIFALFYVLNNTKIMRDMRIKSTYMEGPVGFIINWLYNFMLMAGGVMLIVLLEYIPFFAELGPGADLLFGSTFGGPFMSILILFVPQVLFFSILCTYCYRKTGRAYTGALIAAMLACWIVTGGSAIL